MPKSNGTIDPLTGLVNLNERGLKTFWSQVDKNNPNGCWIWAGHKSPDNYGVFKVFYEDFQTHRLSWMLANGKIPEGLCVLHNCPGGDNSLCVNPAHLWIGTVLENRADCVKKDRHSKGAAHGPAKLTDAQVVEILNTYIPKYGNGARLARKFGVGEGAISRIVRGRTWRHINKSESYPEKEFYQQGMRELKFLSPGRIHELLF